MLDFFLKLWENILSEVDMNLLWKCPFNILLTICNDYMHLQKQGFHTFEHYCLGKQGMFACASAHSMLLGIICLSGRKWWSQVQSLAVSRAMKLGADQLKLTLQFHRAALSRKILLTKIQKWAGYSHKLYMWHSLAGNLILVSIVLLCLAKKHYKAALWNCTQVETWYSCMVGFP